MGGLMADLYYARDLFDDPAGVDGSLTIGGLISQRHGQFNDLWRRACQSDEARIRLARYMVDNENMMNLSAPWEPTIIWLLRDYARHLHRQIING